MVLFIFLVAAVFAQEDYDYLKITTVAGRQYVSIRARALTLGTNFLEKQPVTTVTLQKFMDTEPTITRPEGFFLCEDFNDWRKKSDHEFPLSLSQKRSAQQAANLAPGAAVCLFGDSLKDLRRDQFIMLWISLTRKAVKNSHLDLRPDFEQKSWKLAQIGELVWALMPKSWTVEDVRVFPLAAPDAPAVNLLVDAGANIMTKIIIFPEIQYHKKDFSYDLVNKSSRDLKDYAVFK